MVRLGLVGLLALPAQAECFGPDHPWREAQLASGAELTVTRRDAADLFVQRREDKTSFQTLQIRDGIFNISQQSHGRTSDWSWEGEVLFLGQNIPSYIPDLLPHPQTLRVGEMRRAHADVQSRFDSADDQVTYEITLTGHQSMTVSGCTYDTLVLNIAEYWLLSRDDVKTLWYAPDLMLSLKRTGGGSPDDEVAALR